jgi:hypothetical protein
VAKTEIWLGAKANASGGSVSRWKVGADVGRGAIATRGQLEVGHAPLPEYESLGGSERSGMNTTATTFRLPLRWSRTSPSDRCLSECAKNSGHYPSIASDGRHGSSEILAIIREPGWISQQAPRARQNVKRLRAPTNRAALDQRNSCR